MDNLVVRVAIALCDDIGTPRAKEVKNLIVRGEWTELLKLRVRPQDYTDSETYWSDSMVTELFRKCDIDIGVDREAEAVKTFYACEAQNLKTNQRLYRYQPDTLYLEDQDVAVYSFIEEWRKDIKAVLGPLPDHLTPRFSGGATYADSGLLITTPDKMSSIPTITQGSRCLLPQWQWTSWYKGLARDRPWQSDPLTVRGNKFFTVPKDSEKFRGCCKEPSINVCYQLDVGRCMKSRLLRIGIDLKNGQLLHRLIARSASLTGAESTIDMSNASDTVCRVLPRVVLPENWWELLNSLRSTHTRIKGKWVRLEKFSSMGNGFTFELESLIFATLARTVIRQEGGDPDLVKCYGDDLIVPVQHTSGVLAALRFFGFTPNEKKTFVEGPFRESCGGDFFDGVPVRAHYLEKLPDEPQHWISFANGLRRVAKADGAPDSRWGRVRRAWLRCLDAIPSDIRRCRGPEHLGDVVIHDEPEFWARADTPQWNVKTKYEIDGVRYERVVDAGPDSSWEASYVFAYLPVPIILPWNNWIPSVQLASCTLGLPSRGVTPRDGVSGFRIGRVCSTLTSSWLPSNRHLHKCSSRRQV